MSQEQLSNQGHIYKNGCSVNYGGITSVTVGIGKLRDSTNNFDIDFKEITECDITFNGANGLDTGTVAPNTTYGLYVLFDPSYANKPALLLSTAYATGSSPVMPSVNGVTYSAYRLIDFVLTNSSSQVVQFHNTIGFDFTYKQFLAPIPVLSNGKATTYTLVDLTPYAPTTGFGRVKLQANYTPFASGETAKVSSNNNADLYILTGDNAEITQNDLFDIMPFSPGSKTCIIYYKITSASAPAAFSLSLIGYEFIV